MTFKMEYRTTRWGSWVNYDIPANGVAVKRLTISYSHPSRLEWSVIANESSFPIPRLSWIRLWDDTGLDETFTAQSSTNPLFLGLIVDVEPGSHANEVNYVAYDPTYWAAKSVPVMSLPYLPGSQPSTAPQPMTGAVARLVTNVANTGDDDYSYAAGQNGTVGQIIAGLLEYHYQPLYWLDAAPGDGTNNGNDVPYASGDLNNMSFVPQQKIVWESQTIRSAVEQMWRHEPRFRMLWNPASKRWRFIQITTSPAVTLNFNDPGLHNDYPMIACEIKPNYEDCCTAVSICGPPANSSAVYYWDDTLTTIGDANIWPISPPIVIDTYSPPAGGIYNAVVYQTWQIYDPAKRPGSRTMPDWVLMGVDQYQSVPIRQPTFQVSWNYGGTWIACSNVWFDFLLGEAHFVGVVPYVNIHDDRGQSIVPGSTQVNFPPNAYRLYWSPYDAPLQVRYPSSGYQGTAYDLLGLVTEYRLYDESLAIGREFGVPVTSTARRAEFTKLASYLHEVRKDVIYTGSAVLAGVDYSWCRLNKRVNLADHVGTTTGWESINAVVTDVEYTYGDSPTTSLTFNGNWLELYGEDPAALRERLRIRSFEQRKAEFPTVTAFMQKYTTYFGNEVDVVQGVKLDFATTYVDNHGHVEKAEGH